MKARLLVLLIALASTLDLIEARAKGGGGAGGGGGDISGSDAGYAIRDRNREFEAPANEVVSRFLMIQGLPIIILLSSIYVNCCRGRGKG